jgi:hypothetical protein
MKSIRKLYTKVAYAKKRLSLQINIALINFPLLTFIISIVIIVVMRYSIIMVFAVENETVILRTVPDVEIDIIARTAHSLETYKTYFRIKDRKEIPEIRAKLHKYYPEAIVVVVHSRI